MVSSFYANFVAMKTAQNNPVKLSENIIIADADYADTVAFDLIVNFEQTLAYLLQNIIYVFTRSYHFSCKNRHIL